MTLPVSFAAPHSRSGWGPVLAAGVFGVCYAAAFPKWDLTFLLPLALPFLYWALKDVSPGRAFRLGFLAGLVANAGLLYWIVYVTHVFGRLPVPLAVGVMLLLAGYLALYRAVWAWGVARAGAAGLNPLWFGPALWVALEYVQTYLFSGFPWGLLGAGLYRFPLFIQVADLAGVYGVSFLLALAGTWLFLTACPRFQAVRHERRREALALILLMLWVGYGAYRLDAIGKVAAAAPKIPVGLTQGNIQQGEKWNPKMVAATLDRYAELTRRCQGARLIIWPETAAPFLFLRNPEFTPRVQEIGRASGAHLFFGAPAYELTPAGDRFFNRAYLLDPEGQVAGYYDKAHLVPFGEYVPLQRILFFVPKMVPMVGDFAEGPVGAVVHLPEAPVGPLICFESIFAYLSRAQVRNGARLLVTITNDAWFGETSAPYQHLAWGVFRCVEGRVAMARAANTGISAFIGPEGRILWTSPLNTTAAHTLELPLMPGGSLYSRVGDVFAWLCLAGVCVAPLLGRRRR
ncbi:MAG: apolipoprotein N-acyltransferase [Syntrophobacterales bacterium]|nr:apolipoprotein N-acyltransferase [Syntrophobacterales bacterium]